MYEAVFVDVDGTLTKGKSVWERIHNYFGVQEKSHEYYLMARRKEINYEAWATMDAELWKDRPYGDLYHAIFPVDLVKDAKEGILLLKKHFKRVYLVSGGIDILVEDVKVRVGADDSLANRILHHNGKIQGKVEIHVGDSKLDSIRYLANRDGFELSNTAAIGDDFNDVEMFQGVKHSIAYNSKTRDLDLVACAKVSSESFLDPVLRLIELL